MGADNATLLCSYFVLVIEKRKAHWGFRGLTKDRGHPWERRRAKRKSEYENEYENEHDYE